MVMLAASLAWCSMVRLPTQENHLRFHKKATALKGKYGSVYVCRAAHRGSRKRSVEANYQMVNVMFCSARAKCGTRQCWKKLPCR